MRIILDTDKKTITVPWNYAQKIDEMNRIVTEAGGDNAKKWDFKNYIESIWAYCIKNSDTCLKVADKPAKKDPKNK
ncbi:MAG: hypothetical protein PUE85_08645 [Firmicutes bacterium]|nr:hypothetical protein [Bacillota bacterium]